MEAPPKCLRIFQWPRSVPRLQCLKDPNGDGGPLYWARQSYCVFGYAPRNGPSSHPNVLAIPPSHGRYRYAGMFCINSGVGVAADVFASSVINIYSNTHCSVFVSLVTAIMYVQVFSDVCLVCSQVRVAPGMLSPVLIGRFVFFLCVITVARSGPRRDKPSFGPPRIGPA